MLLCDQAYIQPHVFLVHLIITSYVVTAAAHFNNFCIVSILTYSVHDSPRLILNR